MHASGGGEAPMVEDSGPAWPAGPAEPALTQRTVHVWRADLATCELAPEELLSAEELERAAAIVDERRRELWQRSHGVLRALLGRYLAIAPAAVELSFAARGKPELVLPPPPGPGGSAAAGISFNLSHSGHLALYGFAAEDAVGVDVELARTAPRRDHVALARRALGEVAASKLEQLPLPLREGEFLRLWTRHEAVLKCRGAGIGAPASADARVPWLATLDLGAEGVGAVACSSAPRELCLWSWSAEAGGGSS